jgi:integrase
MMVKLLVLTGQRRDEVAGMRWSEVTGDLWIIPGARTKNGLLHEVPLSTAAQAVLAGAPRIPRSEFVLSTNGTSPVCGFAKAKNRLDVAALTIARKGAATRGKNDSSDVQIVPWRLHDLRRTLASGLARLGQPVHVIEAVLNHRWGVISGVAAIYNRHQYFAEKQAALEAWGEFVQLRAGRVNG